MTAPPDDPTGRALALLSCLTSRPHWSGRELAVRMGVTTRTVRRDIDRLRRLGYDVDAAAGTDGGYRLRTVGTPPPLFLDADEAVAVVSALLTATVGNATGMVGASTSALAKLHHALPAAVRGRAEAVRRAARTAGVGKGPDVDPNNVAVLAESCRDAIAVRFGYVGRDGRSSARRVEPHALITVRSVWYLVGYDLDRADWRMFRVDRVVGDVETTGHGIARRTVPGGDPLAFVGASLAEMPYEHTVELVVGSGRESTLATLSWLNPRRVETVGRRSCRIRLGAADLAELTRQVVDVIGAVPLTSIDAPPTVRAHLLGAAARLTAALVHETG